MFRAHQQLAIAVLLDSAHTILKEPGTNHATRELAWLRGEVLRDPEGQLRHLPATMCCEMLGSSDDGLKRICALIEADPAEACRLLRALQQEIRYRDFDPTATTYPVRLPRAASE